MIELTVEGIPQPVRVDPSFRDLSPEEQGRTVDQIRSAWDAQNRAAPTEPGLIERAGGAVRHGVGNMLRGGAATLRQYDAEFGSERARNYAGTLQNALPEDPNYQPAFPEFVEGLRNMDRRALEFAPRAILEAAPSLAGSMLAYRLGGAPGVVAFGAGQSAGNIAEQRAQNDGRETTTREDRAIGLGAGVGIGLLDRAGVAPIRGGGGAATGVAGRVGQAARTSAREIPTEAAQGLAEQAAGSAGTQAGLQLDPVEALAEGLTAAGAGTAMRAPGAAARGAVEDVARRGAERAFGDMTPDVAESVVRLNELLDQTGQLYRERTGQEASPDELFNAARGELEGQLRRLTHSAERQGWLDQDAREGSLVRDLIETAVRHNRALVDGTPDETGFSLGQGLGQLDTLTDTPAVFRNGMRALLTDLDQLSRAARKNRRTGPFEQVGKALGAAGSVAGGFATGGPMGALAGAAMNLGGQPLPARVGGAVGRFVDRVAGTQAPGLVLVRDKAERIVRTAGRDAGKTNAVVGELHRVINDERLAARAAMGLPTDPDTLAAEAARAAERRAEREAERQRQRAEREAEQTRKREEAAKAAEEARHMAFTDGNPELERRVRLAKARAQARVAREVAQDLGGETAGRIRAEKQAEAQRVKANARRIKAEQDAEAARQKAEQDRQDAEIAAQIAASENIAFRAALLKARAQRRVEMAAVRDMERDADKQVAARLAAEAEQAAAVEKAKRRTRRNPPGKGAEQPEAPAATPVAQEPAEAAPAPPSANAGPSQPDIVETPNDRPDANARGPMFGWQRYVQTAIRNKGRNATREDMAQSVERLRERGDILDDEADALLGGKVDRAPRRLLGAIIADVADGQGWSFEDTPDLSQAPIGGPPSDFYRGVNKPAAWQGAADYIQGHIQTYRDAALSGDRDLGLAGVLATLGMPDNQVSRDSKRVLARSALKAAPEGQREFRAAALAPWLNGEAPTEGNRPSAPADAPAETVAEPPAPKRRGRPPGTGKNQRAAAAAATPEATHAVPAQPVNDGTTEVNGERTPVTDRVLEVATQAFARTATRLKQAMRDATDLDQMDRAEADLKRAEDRLRELREANAVWRARIIK